MPDQNTHHRPVKFESRITLGNVLSMLVVVGTVATMFFQVKAEIAVHQAQIDTNRRDIAELNSEQTRLDVRRQDQLQRIEEQLIAIRGELTDVALAIGSSKPYRYTISPGSREQ